jgi:hypothetical protein
MTDARMTNAETSPNARMMKQQRAAVSPFGLLLAHVPGSAISFRLFGRFVAIQPSSLIV